MSYHALMTSRQGTGTAIVKGPSPPPSGAGGSEITADQHVDGIRDNGAVQKWSVRELSILGGEPVLLVYDERYADEARAEHPGLVVYFPGEIKELLLRRATPMLSRRIHMIKKVLDGWIVPEDSPWAWGSRGPPSNKVNREDMQKQQGEQEGQASRSQAQGRSVDGTQATELHQSSLWG
jgi:hypothetical protein